MRGIFNGLHYLLSRSPLLVRVAIKIRNQMQRIIALSLADGAEPAHSGEAQLLTAMIPHCDLVVDIGANTGDWTALVLDVDGSKESIQVFAYEPGHGVLQNLKTRFSSDSRVVIKGVAVGAETGKLQFHERLDYPTLSSLTTPGDQVDYESYTVDVVSLDNEAERLGWEKVDYLKIDAEGNDASVIQGAMCLLGKSCIRFMQFEYNSNWAESGYTLTCVRRLLESYGYKLYLVKQAGFVDLDWDRYGEFFSYSNIFAVRKADVALVGDLLL